MSQRFDRGRFEELASGLLDGSLDEAERREVEAALVSSEEARRELLLLAAIHQELVSAGKAEAAAFASASGAGPARPLPRPAASSTRVLGWLAAAGLLAAASLYLGASLRSSAGPSRGRAAGVGPAARGRTESRLGQSSGQAGPSGPSPSAGLAHSEPPAGETALAARASLAPEAGAPLQERPDPEGRGEEPRAAVADLAAGESQPESGPPAPSERGGHIAYVDALEGELELARGETGAWLSAPAGSCVSPGDRLRTKFSRARIALGSGSAMYMNRWTTLAVGLGHEGVAPLVNLTLGEVYLEVAAADRLLAVETPHGRVVDLGTRFGVEASPLAGTTVVCVEGAVEASTDAGSVTVGANQEAVLARRVLAPGPVRKAREPEKRLGWTASFRSPVAGTDGAPGDTNLALGRPATASSVYQDLPEYSPSSGNDGSLDTIWASDGTDRRPWWQVDLGAPCRIERIELVARQDDCDHPMARTGIKVMASNLAGGADWVTIASYSGPPFKHKGTWSAPVADRRAFRYVRIVNVRWQHMHFAEFRVFGRALRAQGDRRAAGEGQEDAR